MARFQAGEASAFDDLLDRHKRPVYAYLRRSLPRPADADDLFQEVFLRVVKAAERWRPEAKFTTWMYTIARNVLIDASRRRKADPQRELNPGEDGGDPLDRFPGDGKPSDEQAIEDQQARAIEDLVDGLPEAQREVFLLKREGLTFEQIGEVAEISKNTAKSRLRYALEKLRDGLRASGHLPAAGTES